MNDLCTFNKTEDGHQITIQFHVDDLKLSCFEEELLKKYVDKINKRFKTKFQELTITTGDIHEYLGMTIDYSHRDERYVKLTMYDFLEDILKEVDEKGDMNGECVTPAQDNLFTVNETSPLLNQDQDDYFHRMVA